MAAPEVGFLVGWAIVTQGASGTVDPTLKALVAGGGSGGGGDINLTDGAVLGDPSAGIGESGIDFSLSGNRRDKTDITGSFTKPAGDFIRESVETLAISIPFKGNGFVSPATDLNLVPHPGVNALLESAGLQGSAWGSGTGWSYVPASTQVCSVKLWIGDGPSGNDTMAWVLQDCETTSMSISFPPGDIAVATFNMTGTVESFAEETTPGFDFEEMSSLSAPTVESVAHTWDSVRGFSDATLTLDNEAEDIADSNAAGGVRTRQTGREITYDATMYLDETDLDYERAELIRRDAPTDLLSFTVGTAAADPAEAFRIRLVTPEIRTYTPDKLGNSLAVNASMRAVSGSANGEFELIWL